MSLDNFVKRTLALVMIAGCFSLGMSQSADAWFGHHWRAHRYFHYGHFHHRYYSYWPSYSVGYYGGFHRYHAYRPIHYRYYAPTYYYTPTYFAPTIYAAPYYGCFSYNNSTTTTTDLQYAANRLSTSSALVAGIKSKTDATMLTSVKAFKPATESLPQKLAASLQVIELKIKVPEDARVIVNDRPTKATGSERDFVVRGVPLGNRYEFNVRAEIDRNGKTETETKRLVLQGGQGSSLTFNFDDSKQQLVSADKSVETMLMLRVPAKAKVFLDGYEMKQKGEVRIFKTSKLKPGEELGGYTVRVLLTENGLTETREKDLTLVGGESQVVFFDFGPSARLAAR